MTHRNSEEADLALVDKLDSALAHLLPANPAEQHVSEKLKDADQVFLTAALDLEAAIKSLKNLEPLTVEDKLQKEVADLEDELSNKERLLEVSSGKVKEWQRTCDELKAMHNRNLDKFT